MTLEPAGPTEPLPWATLQEAHDWYADKIVRFFNMGNKIIPRVYFLEVCDDDTIGRNTPISDALVADAIETENPLEALENYIDAILNPTSDVAEKMDKLFGFTPAIAVFVAEGVHEGAAPSANARGARKRRGTEPYPALCVTVYTATQSVRVPHRIQNLARRRCTRSPFPEPPAEHPTE